MSKTITQTVQTTGGRRLQRRKRWVQMKNSWILYLMILPPIITVFIFHYVPLYGIQMAFQDYRPSTGIFGSQWVGLKHFKTFIEYPYFWRIMTNTLILSLWSFVTFPMPILFAIMLNELRSNRLRRVSQMVTYAPHFVSTVVVCSMVILFVKQDGGLINSIIKAFGGEPYDFISSPKAVAPLYTISGLWQGLGWSTIIYTSALSGVSPELIEAAKTDGASRMRVIWHVYLPHLAPTIVIMLIMKMGSLMSVGFEKVFLLQNPLNMETSTVLSTFAYQIGLGGNSRQYSYSAAVGLFDNIINIILVIITNFISKRASDNEVGLW